MNRSFPNFTKLTAFWLIIAASFSINLPVGFGSVTLLFFLIFWILSGNYGEKFLLIAKNPGGLIALAFLAFYGLGIFYTSASLNEGLHYFMKYAKLLIIPLVIGISFPQRYKKYVINAFLISLIGYLIVSYLNWFGFFSFGVMRHGTYMALGVYFMLSYARRKVGLFRLVWSLISVITIFNIIFIADVRTGIVTMFALLFVFAIENWGARGIFYWLIFTSIIIFVLKNMPENHNMRVLGIKSEVSVASSPNLPSNPSNLSSSSAGQRIEMYKHTLTLIKAHPLFGGGTGSIRGEYSELIKNDPSVYIRKVTNPHNQFLMTIQELGLFGLLMLIAFWVVHWWQSYRLNDRADGYLLRALIINIAIGSAFNSLLLDSGDGRMYCILAGILLSGYQSNRVSKLN